ncbi:MAG: porin family protein [Gemmatimonadales bacterium]
MPRLPVSPRFAALGMLALAASVPVRLHAQQRELAYGVTGAVNLARISGDNQEGNKSLLGFGFGGFLRTPLGGSLSLQPELAIMGKGSKFEDDAKIRITYLELPVLARVAFGGSDRARPFVVAGPALAVKAGCQLNVAGDKVGCNDQTTGVKSTDLSVVAGAGVESAKFAVSLRYLLGLTNINGNSGGVAVVKNRALSLQVAYLLGKR